MVRKIIDLASIDQGISKNRFIAVVARAVKDAGGPAEAARQWDVWPQHISSALSGNMLPVPGIVKALGYEYVKEIKYRYRKVK